MVKHSDSSGIVPRSWGYKPLLVVLGGSYRCFFSETSNVLSRSPLGVVCLTFRCFALKKVEDAEIQGD